MYEGAIRRASSIGGGRELFDPEEVVRWLEVTGRGNNRQARADVIIHRQPHLAADRSTFDHLTALLCLRARINGPLPPDLTALTDLADDCDPDDANLYTEIAALTDLDLVAVAEQLVEAAYGSAAAFDRLLAMRRRAQTPAAAGPLAPGRRRRSPSAKRSARSGCGCWRAPN
jgi:hypothetical protein